MIVRLLASAGSLHIPGQKDVERGRFAEKIWKTT
jgi:hypothetical protein